MKFDACMIGLIHTKKEKCRHFEKVIALEGQIPIIKNKNYWDLILDFLLNRGV